MGRPLSCTMVDVERCQDTRLMTEKIVGARVLGLYVDASVGKRLASIAVVKRLGIFKRVVRKDSIGWASTCGVLSAELAAIAAALTYAQDHLKPQQQLVVFSDSQHALRAIQAGNSARTGRALLAKIARSTPSLCRAGIDLRFRWSPGHSGIIGNKEADEAARTESKREGKPTAPALERV
jgi:ribonuclease HI